MMLNQLIGVSMSLKVISTIIRTLVNEGKWSSNEVWDQHDCQGVRSG